MSNAQNITTRTCIVCGAGIKGEHTTCWHCRRDAGMDTDASLAAVENATDGIVVGAEYLHFRPSTGRIICVVKAVEVKGDAVIVERVNGPRKGERYPIGSDVLEPA